MVGCPVCGEKIAAPVRVCRWCRAPLRWNGHQGFVEHPPLGAVVPILKNEMNTQPPADEPASFKADWGAWNPSAYGTTISLAKDRTYHFLYGLMRMRDTVMRAVFAAHDAHGTFGLVVRREKLEDNYTEYRLDVKPGERKIGFKRIGGGKNHATYVELAPAIQHPAVAPPGAMNEVIVAAYGASLQGWINGQHALAFHDPTFGIGSPGFAVISSGGPTQMTVQVVEIGMIGA